MGMDKELCWCCGEEADFIDWPTPIPGKTLNWCTPCKYVQCPDCS